MPRSITGVYTVPSGINPVVAGTTILDSWANPTLADVAQGITDSLDRYGRGGMQAALGLYDGTAAAPGLAFASEPTTGLYRPSAGNIAFSILGTKVANFSADKFVFGGGSGGSAVLAKGDATHSGRIEFYSTAGNRQGYIGDSVTDAAINAGTLMYVGGKHHFEGHMGVNATVQAWGLGGSSLPQSVVQLRGGAATSYDENNAGLIQGAYYDGTQYKLSKLFAAGSGPSLTNQSSGVFTWYVGGSGAADSATTMVQKMRLSYGGILSIGNPSGTPAGAQTMLLIKSPNTNAPRIEMMATDSPYGGGTIRGFQGGGVGIQTFTGDVGAETFTDIASFTSTYFSVAGSIRANGGFYDQATALIKFLGGFGANVDLATGIAVPTPSGVTSGLLMIGGPNDPTGQAWTRLLLVALRASGGASPDVAATLIGSVGNTSPVVSLYVSGGQLYIDVTGNGSGSTYAFWFGIF
jgi:hypothetical protein